MLGAIIDQPDVSYGVVINDLIAVINFHRLIFIRTLSSLPRCDYWQTFTFTFSILSMFSRGPLLSWLASFIEFYFLQDFRLTTALLSYFLSCQLLCDSGGISFPRLISKTPSLLQGPVLWGQTGRVLASCLHNSGS